MVFCLLTLQGRALCGLGLMSREEAEVRRNRRSSEQPVALAVPSQEASLKMANIDLNLSWEGSSPGDKAPPSCSLVLCRPLCLKSPIPEPF